METTRFKNKEAVKVKGRKKIDSNCLFSSFLPLKESAFI